VIITGSEDQGNASGANDDQRREQENADQSSKRSGNGEIESVITGSDRRGAGGSLDMRTREVSLILILKGHGLISLDQQDVTITSDANLSDFEATGSPSQGRYRWTVRDGDEIIQEGENNLFRFRTSDLKGRKVSLTISYTTPDGKYFQRELNITISE
jgi:hypothetical protein